MTEPTIAERAQALLDECNVPSRYGHRVYAHLSDAYTAGARSRDPLIARLREYAAHKDDCDGWEEWTDSDRRVVKDYYGPCTCGFAAVLAEVAP